MSLRSRFGAFLAAAVFAVTLFISFEGVCAKAKKKGDIKRSSFFFSVVKSYHTQGKRTLQTNEDGIYDLEKFTGESVFFTFGRDFSLTDSYAIRAGLVLRNMNLEGNVSQESSPTFSIFKLEQKFYGMQLGLKYRNSNWKRLRLLGEFEFDRSYSQKLIVKKGPDVDDSQLEDVSHAAMAVSVLYDWTFSKRWSVEPSIRYGMILSAPSFISLSEILVTMHFR